MALTPNRSYPLPDPSEWVADDVHVLIAAYTAIDLDMASLFTALGGKAATVHTHSMSQISGLDAALGDKSALNHSHSLASLSDVNATGAANGMVLVYAGGQWVVSTAAAAIGTHAHAISDVTGLQPALDSKLTEGGIGAVATKTTPVDADVAVILDSQAGNAIKRLTWANLKAVLKAYFDTLYIAAGQGVAAGIMADFGGDTAPTGWLLCDGSAVSRTTYAALFAAVGTKWGVGDGSSTFNLPDLRDRLTIGKGDMGGTAAHRVGASLSGTRASTANGIITGLSSTAGLAVGMQAFGTGIGSGATIQSIDSGTQVTLSAVNTAIGTGLIRFAVADTLTLGAAGGSATQKLTTAQIPAHNHTGVAASAGAHTHTYNAPGSGVGNVGESGPAGTPVPTNTGSAGAHTHTLTIDNAGGGQAFPMLPPVAVVNKIIKT